MKAELLSKGVVYVDVAKNRRHYNRILMVGVSMKRAFFQIRHDTKPTIGLADKLFFQFHLFTAILLYIILHCRVLEKRNFSNNSNVNIFDNLMV